MISLGIWSENQPAFRLKFSQNPRFLTSNLKTFYKTTIFEAMIPSFWSISGPDTSIFFRHNNLISHLDIAFFLSNKNIAFKGWR
jgi:hypothetical protein